MSVLKFILLNAHFCLSYKKINYCKIQNGIVKNTISSDGKYFLVCIKNIQCPKKS